MKSAELYRSKITPTPTFTREELRRVLSSRKEEPLDGTKSLQVSRFKSLLLAISTCHVDKARADIITYDRH